MAGKNVCWEMVMSLLSCCWPPNSGTRAELFLPAAASFFLLPSGSSCHAAAEEGGGGGGRGEEGL